MKPATKRKPIVRDAPKPPSKPQPKPKRSFGMPFALVCRSTGKPVLDGQVLVIPDHATAPTRGALPCLPAPTVLRRRQFARLLREWRNDPDTPLASRNRPTMADLIGMSLYRFLEAGKILTPEES